MTNHDVNLLGINTDFIQDKERVIRKQTQEIPQWHLDNLKAEREAASGKREGEFMKIASIPTVIIEKWMREGFDVIGDKNITGRDIVRRLRAENLDAFLTTEKNI